jgi:localization factor PodJL
MTAGAPRSARQVDPATRELAEDLARRSGMTLNEWLARLIADEGPEDATSQDYFAQSSPNYVPIPRTPPAPRYETAGHPADEVGRVAQALERLSDRIETAESRQALAIAGVERSVREVIARIDAGEREQMQVAARFEGVTQEVQTQHGKLAERMRRIETEAQGPRSAEALRALEGAIGKVAGHVYETERRSREAITDIGGRVERLGASEQLTASAIRELQSACGALDGRLGVAEHAVADGVEQAAANLSARVEAVREELADRLAATADARFDRVEQALAQMSEHVRTAEQRSASALERMGREVLEVAQTLSRRVQGVEHRSAEAADRTAAEVSRIANAVEGRLAHADSIQAQALEKLGGEIARITERLADRIASAERRSAQAIDDVGEQVSRVTERIGQRHERAAGELADRIRQSEERTARLLEEARQKIDARLAETQGRLSEIQAKPAAPTATRYEDPDDSLFGDVPFPAYDAPPPAERPFARPAAIYAPTLRQTRPEPPAFEEEDFDAAAALSDPLDDPAPEPPALVRAAVAPVVAAPPEAELGPVELEPNVGFDMDDEPAAPIAAEAAPAVQPAPAADLVMAASEPAAEPVEAPALEAEPVAEAAEAAETPSAAPLTTREVIERARAAARAASERERPSKSPRTPLRQSDEGVLEGLSFGRSRKRPPNLTGALMVASLLAAVSLSAGGFVVLEGQPGGKLPQRVADAIALVRGERSQTDSSSQNQPSMAALAVATKPADAEPSAADLTKAYSAAVAKVSSGEADGVTSIRQLADQGYAPAQFYLSMLYQDGKAGLKKDPAQARHWTERAADGGDRAAMHNLALDDFQGVGGPRDPAAAAEWFRRAADLGLLDSQFNLAGLYEHGQGVSQNAAEAYKWYLIAAHAGDAEARTAALRLRAQLTPEARAVAERAAAAFTPTTPAPAATLASATSGAGAGSPDLVTAQRALNQLGYYQGPTDGVSSPALRMAIAAYQRDQSLPVTGDADAATVGKLAVYTR